ncbi:hypothetical protein [Frigidibacter sp. ROC022]|uniref:hypothetical protein n=1 Tax=Frigidibacter sp. ROC022 TaxID=2971796 RepID=UPI00215A4EDC|nr:hypothetical protein [Frigidibacter sp. ROC022]MCR8725227.1 hypothetical protein [Frigidibacter sp. ROC022]
MNRVRVAQRILAFIGIYWVPEPKTPKPARARRARPRASLSPLLRRGLGFVGVWLEPAEEPRPRRSL